MNALLSFLSDHALEIALSIPLGLLWANFLEWSLHKFVLHGLGKNRNSFFSFHWFGHHQPVRLQGFHDAIYTDGRLLAWNPKTKEIVSLFGLILGHIPVIVWAPFFYLTLLYTTFNYYHKHRKAHLDPDWARRKLPWHYDHHMGPDQDKNWCVTQPWCDHIFRSRERYTGTELEARDIERRQERAVKTVG